MPVIKIELTRENVSREQKRALIQGVTALVGEILNKDPMLTHVVIQEFDTDNWGYDGEQVSILREQGISSDKK
ncbi:tautomerase family protein [Sphingobacterium sp. MYb382]|uniref:tautomerase family protein n=1 Tax=Sphingobacterium sp. MYb382 TaxID=2745278 RepID=UPI00309B655E